MTQDQLCEYPPSFSLKTDLRLLACVPGAVETQSMKGTGKCCGCDGNLSLGKGVEGWEKKGQVAHGKESWGSGQGL